VYVAVTRDKAQRRDWAFYEAINLYKHRGVRLSTLKLLWQITTNLFENRSLLTWCVFLEYNYRIKITSQTIQVVVPDLQ